MSDENPKIWIEHYDLNLGVRGGDQDSIDDVREVFDAELESAVERDPKLGEGLPEERGVE